MKQNSAQAVDLVKVQLQIMGVLKLIVIGVIFAIGSYIFFLLSFDVMILI